MEKEPQKGSIFLIALCQPVVATWLLTVDVNFGHLGKGVSSRLLHCKVIALPVPFSVLYVCP